MSTFAALKGQKLNVHQFPRPPALEQSLRHVRVVWGDTVLADSKQAYWVLETTHPPTYYIPPSDCDLSKFTESGRSTFCEWKGAASYYDIEVPGQTKSSNRAWFYKKPTPAFKPIKDYISFYVGPWDCYVNGEKVEAQPGDFYGGWMTRDIDGGKKGVKGGPGTWGW